MDEKIDSVATESPSHFSYLEKVLNRLATQSPGQDILSRVETTNRSKVETRGQSPSTVWDYA